MWVGITIQSYPILFHYSYGFSSCGYSGPDPVNGKDKGKQRMNDCIYLNPYLSLSLLHSCPPAYHTQHITSLGPVNPLFLVKMR